MDTSRLLEAFLACPVKCCLQSEGELPAGIELWRVEAQVSLEALEFINGRLPRGATVLVRESGIAHRNELMEDWKLCEQMKTPNLIMPLE